MSAFIFRCSGGGVGNPCPHLTLTYLADRRNITGEALGKVSCAVGAVTYMPHIFWRQSRRSVAVSEAALLKSIDHILSLRPANQMSRITAQRIVTRMHDNLRRIPIDQPECEAVRTGRFCGAFAIAVRRTPAAPRPTRQWSARLIDLRPKQFWISLETALGHVSSIHHALRRRRR